MWQAFKAELLRLRHLPHLLRALGWSGTVRYALRRQKEKVRSVIRNDVLAAYDFVQGEAVPTPPDFVPPPRTITWAIPGFHPGSGGHTTIFRLVRMLEERGYRCHLAIVAHNMFSSAEAARQVILDHFFPLQATVSIGEESMPPAEFTFATSWETAYSVRRCAHTRHRLYLVQDFEPGFFPVGSTYAFAEATYRFGFEAVTAGDWLASLMRERYGLRATPFAFGYDREHYRPTPRRSGPRRVFFYARSVTFRRGFELGLLALHRVHQAAPDVEFVLAGWDAGHTHIPFPHLNAGVITPRELADVFCQCDAALVISLTNVSLMPVEMMACGLPIVSNRGPNVEWLMHDGETAILTEATPEALAAGLLRVLNDDALRQRLIANGHRYAEATDWQEAGTVLADVLQGLHNEAAA